MSDPCGYYSKRENYCLGGESQESVSLLVRFSSSLENKGRDYQECFEPEKPGWLGPCWSSRLCQENGNLCWEEPGGTSSSPYPEQKRWKTALSSPWTHPVKQSISLDLLLNDSFSSMPFTYTVKIQQYDLSRSLVIVRKGINVSLMGVSLCLFKYGLCHLMFVEWPLASKAGLSVSAWKAEVCFSLMQTSRWMFALFSLFRPTLHSSNGIAMDCIQTKTKR